MDFKQIFKQLKSELITLFKDKYGDFKEESKHDVDAFLNTSKEKLKRWALLLESGDLTKDDFEWLVNSQKDLLTMHALQKAGVSKISLGHFKNNIVNKVVNVVFGLVF